MVALGSCMRKLVHIIYGILTSGEEFDPNYEQKRNGEEEGRTRKPQTGCYPEDERSSESSPKTNNGEKIPTYQLAGGET